MSKTKTRHAEIGIDGGNTVVIRIPFNNAYRAIEWHDRVAAAKPPFTISFMDHAPVPVDMEAVAHPIESFPVEIDPGLPFEWRVAVVLFSIAWALFVRQIAL